MLKRLLTVTLLISSAGVPARADDHDPGRRILRADMDLESGLLFINGQDLPRRDVKVFLGTSQLEVVSSSRTDIVARVARVLAPATYLLSVSDDLHFAVSIGDTGPAGPRGPKGDPGPAGPTGAKGGTGPAGPAGPAGAKGELGPAGPAGAKGELGPAGAKGDIGPAGPTGPKGEPGMPGFQGDIGPAGPQGDIGPMGPQGPTGAIGETGAIGPIGPQGPIGTFTATTCTYVTGAFVAGTLSPVTTSTVSCPNGAFAVSIMPTWSAWSTASNCTPVSRRTGPSTVATDWLSHIGEGTGCLGNSLGTMTMCCP